MHQTWDTEESIPDCCKKVISQNRTLNPDWVYAFYSLDDRRNLIKNHFESHVLDAYDKLPNSTSLADMFRLCCLYVHGGMYMDVKSSCGDLSWLVHRVNGKLMYCKWPYPYPFFNHKHHAATSFLLWPRHHPVLLNVIEEVVRRIARTSTREKKIFITHITGPDMYQI